MSKQTNAFQKAILHIYEELKDTDAEITESGELMELDIEDEVRREIDVLIEKKLESKIFRIAIECRGRKNVDDITWIDSLIGKYINRSRRLINKHFIRIWRLFNHSCQ